MQDIFSSLDMSRILTDALVFLPKIAAAIAVLVIFLIISRVTRPALKAALNRANLDENLVDLLVESIYRYAIMIVGVVMAADQLGINVAAALAGIGVAGIAIGFAAQDSLANLISGILIFWDKPFIVGDWITAEGQYGQVTDITLRSTRIRTPRNSYVVIPNKSIIDTVLENHSKHGELRVDVPLGIAYKEDIPEARRVLLAAVEQMDGLKSEPRADVVVDELGGSSVNLKVRVWIEEAKKQRGVFFKVLENCKLALDDAGIEIPFPHLQLHVDGVKDRIWNRIEDIPARWSEAQKSAAG